MSKKRSPYKYINLSCTVVVPETKRPVVLLHYSFASSVSIQVTEVMRTKRAAIRASDRRVKERNLEAERKAAERMQKSELKTFLSYLILLD